MGCPRIHPHLNYKVSFLSQRYFIVIVISASLTYRIPISRIEFWTGGVLNLKLKTLKSKSEYKMKRHFVCKYAENIFHYLEAIFTCDIAASIRVVFTTTWPQKNCAVQLEKRAFPSRYLEYLTICKINFVCVNKNGPRTSEEIWIGLA